MQMYDSVIGCSKSAFRE